MYLLYNIIAFCAGAIIGVVLTACIVAADGRDMCAKNAVMLDGREVGLRATGKDEFCSYGR